MLTSMIHSVVINPPWNVPAGIAQRELWPKEKANPRYFAKHGYRIIPVQGGQPRLQQASGDQSALGRFKFDFDNPFAVYLHDTPSKGGFDLYARNASHGCVRVEKPRALAEALLRVRGQAQLLGLEPVALLTQCLADVLVALKRGRRFAQGVDKTVEHAISALSGLRASPTCEFAFSPTPLTRALKEALGDSREA